MSQFNIQNTEVLELYSKEIDQEYIINVGLPPNYSQDEEPYPVVYVTDGGSNFGTIMSAVPLMQMVGEIPRFITVGIEYKGSNYRDTLILRARDLTPIADPEYMRKEREQLNQRIGGISKQQALELEKVFKEDPDKESGGAKKFLSFINNNLKPLIESKFNIDNLNQSYCGFSFGGLFGLYTLFTSTESFQRYVIGSPSIWWKNKFILDLEEQFFISSPKLPAIVYMSIGELEEEHPNSKEFKMVTNYNNFTDLLYKRNYQNFQFFTEIIGGETHFSGTATTVLRGIKRIFNLT